MMKYTSAAVTKILKDLNIISKAFKIITTLFFIGYFTYVLIAQKGMFIVNLTLAILFVLYSVFDLVTFNKKLRVTKKVVKRFYDIIKLILKVIPLAISIYSMYMATIESTPISIILLTLLIILWILQVVLEIVVIFVQEELEYLMAGVNEDVFKRIIGINNVLKKITLSGEKVEFEQPYEKELSKLEKYVKINEEKKIDKKVKKEIKKKEYRKKIFKSLLDKKNKSH